MCFSEMFFACLWSFGACVCCCFYLNTNIRHIIWGGILGAIGWLLYKLVLSYFVSLALGYFLGAFAVALLAEVLASLLRAPATVFLLPGLLPLVPGGGIFSMMRYAVLQDFPMTKQTGYETLVAALAIALGIAVASSLGQIFRAVLARFLKKKHNNNIK